MVYYDIVSIKSVGDSIIIFDIKSMNNTTPNIATDMTSIVDKKGYYLHCVEIENMMLYTLAIKKGFNITNTDIPINIKSRYMKEIRMGKINQLIK